jgi:hypothetical protein
VNAVRVASRTTTAVVAGVAGFSSYQHIVEVARRAGEHPAVAAVLPLSIDGLIVVGTMAMVEDKRAGRRPRLSARVALGFGIVATLAANIASAQPHFMSRCVAAVPAVAFLITVEVLARSGRMVAQLEAAGGPALAAVPAPAVPGSPEPISAPPAPPVEVDGGAAEADDLPAQKLRQDTRTAQQIESAVRAMRVASPKVSQRQIAEAVMVPETTVRRILRRAQEPTPTAPETRLNGHKVLEEVAR